MVAIGTSELPGPEFRSRFGRLTVISDPGGIARRKVSCRCDCGTLREVILKDLLRGVTRSCGCLSRDIARLNHTIHGHTGIDWASATYYSWANMIQRCTNPKNHKYQLYGGRGIAVCDRWRSFANFLDDMGDRPAGTTIDRINNDGGYEPSNCRWATPTQQANNRRPRRKAVNVPA